MRRSLGGTRWRRYRAPQPIRAVATRLHDESARSSRATISKIAKRAKQAA
jgi:hypothetical protein